MQFDPKSPWSDKRVRKAASLAIDRASLAESYVPGSRPIGSLGMKGDPDAIEIPPDPYDREQAKRLLAEAGYPNGFHGGKFYPYEGGMWEYGLKVVDYWKAIGITTEAVLLDKPANVAMRDGLRMRDGSFIASAANATMGTCLARMFGAACYGMYPDMKAVWDEYNNTLASDKRKELIGRLQKMIHEKKRYLPLTQNVSPHAANKKVKGNPFRIQPLFWFFAPLEDAELNH